MHSVLISWILVLLLLGHSAAHATISMRNGAPSISSTRLSMVKGLSLPSFGASKVNNINKLKTSLIETARNTKNGVTATSQQREIMNDLVSKLEKQNKIKNISGSKLSNGSWKLLYTTNEGSSAGKLGPFIGKVVQDVDHDKQFYVNNVVLGNGIIKASLSATWDVLSNRLWKVKFDELTLQLLGVTVTKKSLGGVTGTWRNTFLDDDMRILYAIGGKNTVKENVYILVKEK